MFSVSDASEVSDAIYELLKNFEEEDEYTPEEKDACKWLYSYFAMRQMTEQSMTVQTLAYIFTKN